MNQANGTTTSATQFPVAIMKTQRKGIPLAVGVISAGVLTSNFEIPRRERTTKGYQRETSKTRVNKLVNQLTLKRVDLPTAVLLNMRDFDESANLVVRDGVKYLNPNGNPLFVVDGQHRIVALYKLVESDPERWSEFEIPFTCLLGADEREEMEQFYVVNSTAKSVRTDLAFDLLKQRAETDPEVMDALIESNEAWKVDAQALTEKLAETAIWQARIRFPGDEKAATTINSSGMASSLKVLLDTPYFGKLNSENQIKILDAYWKGVNLALPEVIGSPSEYAIQKASGVQVMHALLVQVIELLRSNRESTVDPQAYAELLREPLEELTGDSTNSGIVEGAEFWRSGADGAAGQYSSNAGRRVLAAKLKGLLPELELE